jgi:hypothetical protein
VSAWAPLYPPLGRQARIQGAVILRVSTDGKRIVKFESESGPPLLVQAVKENTKTWEFEPHKPISFEVRFQYRLIGYHCDARCNCSGDEKESVLLQLPAYAELTTTLPMICDPAVPIEKK